MIARCCKRGRSKRSALHAQLTQTVANWANRPAIQINVHPVIDLTTHDISTSPEVTDTLRQRTAHRRPSCAFPHCGKPATACDADHHIAASQGGATCDCNLHPLCRHHHRLKTFTGWTYIPLPPDDPDQTGPDNRYLWTDPHGMVFLVDRHGTRNLTPTAWNGCRQPA